MTEAANQVQGDFQIWSSVKWNSTADILCSWMLLCQWWPCTLEDNRIMLKVIHQCRHSLEE